MDYEEYVPGLRGNQIFILSFCLNGDYRPSKILASIEV